MKAFLDGYSFSIEERRGELYAVFNHSAEEMPDGRCSIPTQMRLRESVLSQVIADFKSREEDIDTTFVEQALEALREARKVKNQALPS